MSELKKGQLATAVLLIVFNRPLLTKKVFQAIRDARPSRLYVAGDGPRPNFAEDKEAIDEVRSITGRVDWPCETKTLFRRENKGCGPGVKGAIDWFFSFESEGIVLEDDTVPNASFFKFCDTLLDKYRDDQRIGMISGTNHVGLNEENPDSYIFSKNKACWGWATWRRAWVHMDYTMLWRNSPQARSVLDNMGSSRHHKLHWHNAIRLIDSGAVSAWDWQWYFSLAGQNQVTIFPPQNLVANIGFGPQATHTRGRAPKAVTVTHELQFPLRGANLIVPNRAWDERFERLNMKRRLLSLRRAARKVLALVRVIDS